MNKARVSKSGGKHGAVLVITLLMIVVLAVATVAFMQNTSTDRQTARSIGNHYRAQLAAESGISSAVAVIAEKAKTDDFIILKSEAQLAGATRPVFYIGEPSADAVSYYPLFSGGAAQTDLAIDQMPDPSIAFPENAEQAGNSLAVLPHLSDNGNMPVGAAWVEIKDQQDNAVARYAFWVEDLGGYLDADVTGAQPLQRDGRNDPAELGVFTLFRPTEQVDSAPEDGLDTKLFENRQLADGQSALYSLKTLGLPPFGLGDGLSTDGKTYNQANDYQQFFTSNLKYFDEPQIIPRGFGYADAGQRKLNLNTAIAKEGDAAVQEIADKIKRNLPDFDNRKGGFPESQDYIKTLAANIIDYADVDNNATVGVGYRGVDSYPFVTQFYARTTWKQPPGAISGIWYAAGAPATWRTKTTAQYFLQVWNPSDKVIDEGVLMLDLSPAEGSQGEVRAFFYDGDEVVPFFPFPDGAPALVHDFAASPLQPNEFRALSGPEFEYEIDTDIDSAQPRPSTAHGSGPSFAKAGGNEFTIARDFGYFIRWNGEVVDRPGGITRGLPEIFTINAGTLQRHPTPGGTGPDWRGGQPGLRHGLGMGVTGIFDSEQAKPLLGDPRGTYYLSSAISDHRYDRNASWWGRNKVSPDANGNIKTWFVGEARLNAWPDGAHHDEIDAGYGIGGLPPSGEGTVALRTRRSMGPDDVPAEDRPAIAPDKAPSRISNAGEFSSITELGNIYDPIQWRPRWDANDETVETVEAKWRNLGSDPDDPEAMVADSEYIAPSTLRIGRGEYAAFDTVGQRASQLLDLFTLEATTPVRGRININTASRDVLRTLGAGIAISSDPRLEPPELRGEGKLFGPHDEEQGDLLADAIIQSRPFLSPAQLSHAKIEKDGVMISFFGNRDMWPDGGPNRWLDTAAEEYFRKLFGLVSVRSRNFRIYATGQALSPDGKVTSTVRRVYQIAVEPVRDIDGSITSQKILQISQKEL